MEYPHQQYLQFQQLGQPPQPHGRTVTPERPRPQPPQQVSPLLQPGSGDSERPMMSPRSAAVERLRSLAQCGPDEARYYLQEHGYDLHRAMAARTADVGWEKQHGGQPRPVLQSQTPAPQPATDLQAQLQEARRRLRPCDHRLAGTVQPARPLGAGGAQLEQTMLQPPLQQHEEDEEEGMDTRADLPQDRAEGWEEVRREEARVNDGTAPRESYLTLAGQTLGKLIWGGSGRGARSKKLHKKKHKSTERSPEAAAPSIGPSEPFMYPYPPVATTTTTTSGPSMYPYPSVATTTTTTTTTTTSSTGPYQPAAFTSSVSSPSLYPTRTSAVPAGEWGRRFRSDDSLEINDVARNRRMSADAVARDAEEEEREAQVRPEEDEREGESRLRHLFHSVRNRGKELVERIHNREDGESPHQLPPAAEEELESRRGHRRRGSMTKKERRASLDADWVLVDGARLSHPPTVTTQGPLTDEQYAARLSRQLAEEDERQRKRDEELARRLQRQEEAAVRQRAQAEARAAYAQSGGQRRRGPHGSVQVVLARGPFGDMIVSTDGSTMSTVSAEEQEQEQQPRGRRRRTGGGLVTLLEIMRDMHEMRLAQNMSHESGYGSFAPAQTSRRQDMSYEQLLGLSERIGNVNRGVSHAAMDALPTRTYQVKEKKADEEDNKCTICLCEYEEGDVLRTLPCLHSYHRDCIDHWLKSHNTCPVCKTQINM